MISRGGTIFSRQKIFNFFNHMIVIRVFTLVKGVKMSLTGVEGESVGRPGKPGDTTCSLCRHLSIHMQTKVQYQRLFLQTMSPDSDLKIHLGWNWVNGAGQKTWDRLFIKSWIGIGCVYKDVLKNCNLFHIKSHLMSKNSVHSNSIEVIRPDFHVGTRNWQLDKLSFCEKFSKSAIPR